MKRVGTSEPNGPVRAIAMRYVTENRAMPRGRKPEGDQALSNAERQARYRARHTPPAMARRRQRIADDTGHVCRLAGCSARRFAWKLDRRVARSHRRVRPHRSGGDRAAPRLRPRLATPMKRTVPVSFVRQIVSGFDPIRAPRLDLDCAAVT